MNPPQLVCSFSPYLLSARSAVVGRECGGCRDIQAKNQETVHNNSGNVTVEVMALLDPGHTVRLLIDGDRAAPDSHDLTFRLQGVERGEHTLQALVLDRRGDVVKRSKAVTFFMWQASKQFPNRTP